MFYTVIMATKNHNYSETSIHRFRRGSEKETMDHGKKIDAGALVEIGFAQGPQKLNDGSGKTNYPGTIDRGFTVLFLTNSTSSGIILHFTWIYGM
jgi:hypothetical protein